MSAPFLVRQLGRLRGLSYCRSDAASALLLLLALAFGAGHPASAQCIICPDEEPPEVVVSSPSSSYSGSTTTYSASVTVEWCDNLSLNGNSWLINHNGVTVSGGFTYENHTKPGCILAKKSVGTINLVHGTNTIYAEIRDNNGNVGSGSILLNYTQTHRPPDWGLDPHYGESINTTLCVMQCFETVYAYTTPAYVSMDVSRSTTLMYRSAQARPMALVQVNVGDLSTVLADKISLQLKRPDGSLVTFTNGTTELFFAGDSAHVSRLAAQFDAGSLATGVHNYSLVLTNYWALGGIAHSSTVPVKVLVVNEKDSPFGWGWSLVGLQRIQVNGDTLLTIAEGDGSIGMFRRTTCPSGCKYTSSAGDFSVLTSRASVLSDGIKWDRKYPDGAIASFSPEGRLLRVRDRYSNETTYAYADGRLTMITDPAGQGITFTYGGDNKIETIVGQGGRTVTVAVDGSLNVTAIQEPGGGYAIQSAVYDTAHRLIQRVDRRGETWYVGYDFAGKIAVDSGPPVMIGGQSTRLKYRYRSLEAAVLLSGSAGSSANPGRRLRWDSVRVVSVSPSDDTTRMELAGFGAPVRVEAPLKTETFAYNSNRQLTRNTSRILSQSDTSDVRYTWVGYNRTVSKDAKTQDSVIVEYDTTFNQPTRLRSTDGTELYRAYYSINGRMDSSSTSVGGRTKYTYDSRGRILTQTDPDNHVTTFYRSASGWQNTDSIKSGGRRTVFTYDSYGRTHGVTNPAGYSSYTSADQLNRPQFAIGPLADTTRTAHGDSLYVTKVTDPKGQEYRYIRNALGWVTVRSDTTGSDSSFYDLDGNLTRHVNRRGQPITFEYDSRGRLIRRTLPGSQATDFSYDPAGRFVVIVNSESRDTVQTDSLGLWQREVAVRSSGKFAVRTRLCLPSGVAHAAPGGGSAAESSYGAPSRAD